MLARRLACHQFPIRAYDPEMLYSESEKAWLNRRAEKIARERGWPLPTARSDAEAELVRLRAPGRSTDVVSFPRSAQELPRVPQHCGSGAFL